MPPFRLFERVEAAAMEIDIRSMFSVHLRHIGLIDKSSYYSWRRYMNHAITAELCSPSEILHREAQAFDPVRLNYCLLRVGDALSEDYVRVMGF